MRYDQETTTKLVADYAACISVQDIAIALTLNNSVLKYAADKAAGELEAKRLGISLEAYCLSHNICFGLGSEVVPERSVIAKLSSLGVYKKKEYLTKRGDIPIKKEEYIERIAVLLEVTSDMLESLEKVNKGILMLLAQKLSTIPKLDSKIA